MGRLEGRSGLGRKRRQPNSEGKAVSKRKSRNEWARGFFDTMWCHLAAAGQCDEVYGEEYFRVWYAWVDAGKPYDIFSFITERANAAPPTHGLVPLNQTDEQKKRIPY